MYAEYTASVGLPGTYVYLHGNPILPRVPLDTARDGLMIIGAYPTARFSVIDGHRDVPTSDHLGPFSNESYFDGQRVRSIASGKELDDLYLSPCGISRQECWITNAVKVFLFKEGHVSKYRALGVANPPEATRPRLESLIAAGVNWLADEVRLARPRLLLTLGREVAGVLRGVSNPLARNQLLTGRASPLLLGSRTVDCAHLPHPGILMRDAGGKNGWRHRHEQELLPSFRMELRRRGLGA